MKKILNILFLFSVFIGFSQKNVGNKNGLNLFPPAVPIGNLVSDDFTNFGKWTTTSPAGAFSVSGGDLLINKAVGGGYNLNDYTLLTSYGGSCLENWTIDVLFKVTEKSAACTGFFVGVKSTASFGATNHHVIQFNTNSSSGKLLYYMAGATGASSTSATGLSFSLNDECRLVVSRKADASNGQYFTATVYNLTTPSSLSFNFNFSEAYPITIGTPPTSQFAIYAGVGTLTIHSFSVTTQLYKNANIIALGNSITKGLYSLAYSTRWFSLATAGSVKTNYAMGGPGDRTTQALERVNEINIFNPKTLLVAIGGNDLEAGVALATVQANYQSFINSVTKAGRTIIHLKPTPRDAFNFTTWNAWLDATYGTNNVVDDWTPLKGAGTDLGATWDAGDGVHPNATGHAAIATAVAPFLIGKL